MPRRILVFAPHPDDETLACGGTIAKKVKEGHDIHIIFMTDGRNSFLHVLGITSDPTPEELALIRVQEAKNAASILGVNSENLTFLGFESSYLRNNKEIVEGKVQQILLDFHPDEVYFPDVVDSHRTHQATYDIVKIALGKLNFSPKEYRYVVWGNADIIRSNASQQILVDISAFLNTKKQAIAEYKSQVTVFSKRQTEPLLSNDFLNVFYEEQEVFFSNFHKYFSLAQC